MSLPEGLRLLSIDVLVTADWGLGFQTEARASKEKRKRVLGLGFSDRGPFAVPGCLPVSGRLPWPQVLTLPPPCHRSDLSG